MKKRYPLRTPTVRKRQTSGWLEIRSRNSRSFTLQWDFGSMDWLAVDESYLFPQLLESHPWQHELLRRLNAEGWHLGPDHLHDMKWQTIRPVSEELALWIVKTLPPPLFEVAAEFFEVRFPDGINFWVKAAEAGKLLAEIASVAEAAYLRGVQQAGAFGLSRALAAKY
jgi:hypothetical protein